MADQIQKAEQSRVEVVKSAPGQSWFFAVALVASLGVFGYRHQPTEMGIAATACCMGLIFANLTLFTRFKGLGIDAELRQATEQAQAATQEATATVRQLRELAKALASNAFTITARTGLWGTLPLAKRVAMSDEIRAALATVDFSAEEIDVMSEPVKRIVRHQLARRIQDVSNNSGSPFGVNEEFEPLANFEKGTVAPASQYRAIAQKHNLSSDVFEAITDLEFFERDGKLRRPGLWSKED